MNRKTVFPSVLGLIVIASITGFSSGSVQAQALPPGVEPRFRDGEILVKFTPDVTDGEIEGAFRGASLQMRKHLLTRAMEADGDLGIVQALTSMPVPQAVEFLNRLPGVQYAQPNWVYTHDVANDSYFTDGSLWGMLGPNTTPQSTYGSGAASAWAAGVVGARDVYIGIIDEGLQYNHPDLASNIRVNSGEVPNDGLDNDANGFIDDVYGWNGFGNNGNIYDANSDDHGTHVAGTVGAEGGNNQGVVGVNWTVSMVSGKFLGPDGGATSDAIEVIDYMTQLKTKGVNIVALNNSWGGGGYDPALLESIVRAAKAQILFVAASGNGDWLGRAINTDANANYPSCYNTTAGAGYDSVIAVTSIASDGSKARSANYGATTVDLGAPGVNIWSTLPGGSYGSYSGTSMATPHVTGAIALYAAKYPGVKASAIRDALLASTTATASLSGKTVTGGRLDIPRFLSIIPEGWTPPDSGPPSPPTGLHASAVSSTQITLSWVDNANNETGFILTRTSLTGTKTTINLAANLQSYTDGGLTPNTSYEYTIAVCKGSECVSSAESVSATTLAPPPLATVAFVGTDATTKGNWLGNYGSEGYDILKYKAAPVYGTVTPAGFVQHTWASSTSDTRALQTPGDGSRFAACYYSGTSFTIDVNVTDAKSHKLSLYCVDFDRKGRTQVIQVCDRNSPGTVLNEQFIENFAEGKYLTWTIQGSVIIKVIYPGGTQNAVVSGIFLDDPYAPAAPTSLVAKTVSRTEVDLAWTDNSDNETGFTIERSTSSTTGFVVIGTVAANTTSYRSSNLTRNTTYYFRVRSNPNGKYSNNASAKTMR